MGRARTPTEMLPDWRVVFPEFTDESDARCEYFLGLASDVFSACENATFYLAAHYLTEANNYAMNQAGGGAPVHGGTTVYQRARVGELDAFFRDLVGQGNESDQSFVTTQYGIRFLDLRKRCPGWVLAIGVTG